MQNGKEEPPPPTKIKHTFEELKMEITNDEITADQRERFKNLINQYGDIFALKNSELGGTDILEYEIHLKADAKPLRQSPFHHSAKAREEIDRQVEELL